MAKPKRIGKKYDSFQDKIIDYQKRTLLWLQSENRKSTNFSGEYNALTQLRLDIKEKINMGLDGALTLPGIVQYGIAKETFLDEITTPKLSNDPNLINFPVLLRQKNDSRKKMEIDTQDFISEVFNEKRIQSLLDVIFFGNYEVGWKKGFDEYRIVIAELMTRYCLKYLQSHVMQPTLFGQLRAAAEIADLIKKMKIN